MTIETNNQVEEAEKQQYGEKLLDRTSFFTEFSTNAYLDDFYTKVDDPAMQMVLTFFPNIVARVGKIHRLLDFGAGPTIHIAAAYRNQADEIYLADYLPQNRVELQNWFDGKSRFDWSVPLKTILTREGIDWSELERVQPATREKVRGIFHCDCFADPSVECPKELQKTFDMVVTIFCVEYCCNTYEEYKLSIKNIAEQIKPGGYLVMGGILEETWCSFGGRKFTCLYITKEMMLSALEEVGLFVEKDRTCVLYEINGMFMILAKKQL
ncbi:unnamed protein product [Caenorhabditis auriculariae]|uniref:Uncharacterized protein n=1 Tax=Caenorhabditis auriculariae TaxID=2777116 RepID=A0A8S1H8M2_9PELO|nr:unnamed protein product [Caenorhabditis auriculariae]